MSDFVPNPIINLEHNEQEQESEQPTPPPSSGRQEMFWIKAFAILCIVGIVVLLLWPADEPPTGVESGESSAVRAIDSGADENAPKESDVTASVAEPGLIGSVEKAAPTLPETKEQAEVPELPAQSEQPPEAATPEPEPSVAAAPEVGVGKYFIQVGSFSRSENAIKLSETLHATWPVRIMPSKNGWYRVQVGPFASHAAAEKVLPTLKQDHKLSGFITKHD